MESSSDLIVLASPPRKAPAQAAQDAAEYNEKAVPLVATTNPDKKRPTPLPYHHLSSQHSPAAQASAQWTPYRESPAPSSAYPASASPSSSRPQQPHRARGISHSSYPPRNKVEEQSFCAVLRPWIPLLMYAATSLAFVVAIALYKAELFTYLDELSLWLRADEQYGQAVLFFLIFLTTIPPIPLYSTLIVLSGYTFGAWTGAVISYFAALFGALAVFLVSRAFFRSSIERWLASCASIRRAVRAIERRPKLLFLVRLAPYPYNVMNCLLAASPTLTLHTYTVCTALSLFKVLVHTSVGAGIHSFRDYNSNSSDSAGEAHEENWMGRMYTIAGIALCFVLLVYLSIVARRAVDDELDDAPIAARDTEETRGFLSEQESDAEMGGYPSRITSTRDRQMVEIQSPYKGRR